MVDSASKTKIGQHQAQQVIETAFDGTVSLTGLAECEEGWFNAVYRLGLDDGRTVVLKLAPPPAFRAMRYEHRLMDTEVSMLRHVRENTDVPVPEVLFWDESSSVLPNPYFLMEACRGSLLSELRPRLDDAAQHVIDAQVARHVASINSLPAPAFGRPERTATRHARWSAAFDELVAQHLADAEDAEVELPLPPDELAGLVMTHGHHLDVVTDPRVVHWDLYDTNVFVDAESLDVVGLIDFERVLWADPLMEAQFLGKRANDDLVAAYGAALFDAPSALERRRLYDMYLYLVMIVECAYRNYPTNDIEDLARACLPRVLEELVNQ